MQIKLADNQSLKSAATRYGNSIKTYDDGFGPLWVIQNSMGIKGIVRAESWEDAWSIAEDEIFPRASAETIASFEAEYGPEWMDDGCWNESYGFSGNNGIYEKDLNGDCLSPLTQQNCEEWGVSLEIETEVEPEPVEEFFAWHTQRKNCNRNRWQICNTAKKWGVWNTKILPNRFPQQRKKALRNSYYSPRCADSPFNP